MYPTQISAADCAVTLLPGGLALAEASTHEIGTGVSTVMACDALRARLAAGERAPMAARASSVPHGVTAEQAERFREGKPATTGGPGLSDDEIRERMSGNLCRCGACANIVAAIRAAAAGAGDAAGP